MRIFLYEDPCPKCGNDKMPFDVHCDECYEFSIRVPRGCKLKMINALKVLGYKYNEVTIKGDGSYWSKDEFLLSVEASRQEECTIRQILKEECAGSGEIKQNEK